MLDAVSDLGSSWVEGQELGSKANYPMQNASLEGDLQRQSSGYPNSLDLQISHFCQLFLGSLTVFRAAVVLDSGQS